MRLQRAAGKGRSFHDDLHAFSSGGILFVNNGALRKERVSDGPLFPAVVSCLPPAAYFLSTATKSMQKTPFETDGFKTSFALKSCVRYGL